MDIKLLKTDILSNNIPKFLIFESEEQALSKQYIEHIATTIGRDYKFYTSADAAIYDITTNIKEDYLYVIYNDKAVKTKDAYIETLKNLNRNIIVYFESIDKDTFYKKYLSSIVLFKKLDEYTLLAYATKLCRDHKCTIDQTKLYELVKACDFNLGILLNELNKIFTLNQDSSATILLNYMLHSNFPDYRELNIYEFINKVLNKDITALTEFQKLPDSAISTILCMYNMARKRLLKTKNEYYGIIMNKCFEAYSNVIEGYMDDKLALKYLMYSLFV